MAQITTHLALSHRLITQRQGTRAVWLLLTASVGFLAGESIENILKTTVLHYPGRVNANQIH